MREEASLAVKWPVYGADRPQLQQSLDLDVIPWALMAAERVLGVKGDPLRAGVRTLLAAAVLLGHLLCSMSPGPKTMLDPFTSFRLKTPVLCRMWVFRGPVVGLRTAILEGGFHAAYLDGNWIWFSSFQACPKTASSESVLYAGPDLAVNILRRHIPETDRPSTESPYCGTSG